MLLLASRGLFIGLIAIAVIVVILCVTLSALLYIKSTKVKQTLDADVIRKELYRRETELVIQIFKDKPDASKREALIGELRRIKSAEMLVEEIVKNEKAERGITDQHSDKKKGNPPQGGQAKPENGEKGPAPAPAPQGANRPAPAPAPQGANRPAPAPAPQGGDRPAPAQKPAEKPTED